MSGLFVLVFIIFLVLIIVGGIHSHRKAQERRERLAAFAAQHGWQYDSLKDRNIRQQFAEIALFRRGSNRYGENIIMGDHEGRHLLMFDYHYETESGSGKDRRTQHHHYGIVTLRPSFLLKPLVIRPEGLWDRITEAFGWGDIDFESAEFSRRYHVSGPDRRWAFDVLNPRTMELLLSREKVTLCMTATHLILAHPRHLEPEGMQDALTLCAAVLNGIPEFARESLT
jgi:hypothetical protein